MIVIALLLLGCAASLHAQQKSTADFTPSFPFKDSWWGADAAYSIPADGFRNDVRGRNRVLK